MLSSNYHVFLPRFPPIEIILKPFSLALKCVVSPNEDSVISALGDSITKNVVPISVPNKLIKKM